MDHASELHGEFHDEVAWKSQRQLWRPRHPEMPQGMPAKTLAAEAEAESALEAERSACEGRRQRPEEMLDEHGDVEEDADGALHVDISLLKVGV